MIKILVNTIYNTHLEYQEKSIINMDISYYLIKFKLFKNVFYLFCNVGISCGIYGIFSRYILTASQIKLCTILA